MESRDGPRFVHGLRFGKANRTEVRSCFGLSKPKDIGLKPKTFFFFTVKGRDEHRCSGRRLRRGQ